jgi:lipid-binding SYLF domain-containing protein
MAMGLLIAFGIAVASPADAFGWGKNKSPEKKRAEIHEIEEEVLERLFREEPEVRGELNDAVGYAVFSNKGFNLGVVSTANGKGLAHDNEADRDIYMRMYSVGAGIGVGVKKFSAVFVFHSRDAFDQFVDKGWDFSGQADAAATTDAEKAGQPGAMDETVALMKDVSVYQLPEAGLAVQATLQGTKYWKNDELN